MIRRGRPQVKRALQLAALKPFYQPLGKSDKPSKVAIISVARKLEVILNARLKDLYDSAVPESHEGLPRMGERSFAGIFAGISLSRATCEDFDEPEEQLEFIFAAPENTAFFRVEAR